MNKLAPKKSLLSGFSIRSKLTLIMVAVAVTSVTLAGIFPVAYNIVFFQQHVTRGIETAASIIANHCGRSLSLGNSEEAHDELSSLRSDQAIQTAWLFRLDGSVLATYSRTANQQSPQAPEIKPNGVRIQEDKVLVFVPVSYRGQPVGTLCLAHDPATIGNFFKQTSLGFLLVVLLTGALSYFLATRFQQSISEPLRKLVDAAKRVLLERDFSVRVPRTSDDEFGRLSDAFNEMLDQIEERDLALRQSEERFRGVYENTVLGLYRTTPEGRILMANRATVKMMGFDSFEEIAERNLVEEGYTDQAQREIFKEIMERDGQIAGLESTWVRRDGSLLHLSESAHVTRDRDGNPLYYDGTIEDITDRKQAAEALRIRERFLACLSEVSQSLLGAHDVEKKLPDLLQMLGETAEVSRTYLFRNHPSPEGDMLSSLEIEWAAPGFPNRSGLPELQNLPYVTNGLRRWVELLGNGHHIAGELNELPESERNRLEPFGVKSLLLIPLIVGNHWYGYIGFDDCSRARKWLPVEIDLLMISAAEISGAFDNARLLEALRRDALELEHRVAERTSVLQAVNQELESFAYSVSHDLRAPLRSIDGFSQALLEDYENEFNELGRDYLHRVRAASQRMSHLIDDLLRLSRITRRELVPQRVNLSAMARELGNELHEQYPEREVEFVVMDCLAAQADPRLLRVAITNMLANAWKFTSKQHEPKIEFGVTNQNGEEVFFVKDNGVGFNMEYAGKLFGAFQRLHAADEHEGTGIGLATVQRIIHRHGGRIWADAKIHNGATFYFTLP